MVNTFCRAVDVGRIWRVAVEEVTQISTTLWSLLLGSNVIIKSGVLWSNFNPSSSLPVRFPSLRGKFYFWIWYLDYLDFNYHWNKFLLRTIRKFNKFFIFILLSYGKRLRFDTIRFSVSLFRNLLIFWITRMNRRNNRW